MGKEGSERDKKGRFLLEVLKGTERVSEFIRRSWRLRLGQYRSGESRRKFTYGNISFGRVSDFITYQYARYLRIAYL